MKLFKILLAIMLGLVLCSLDAYSSRIWSKDRTYTIGVFLPLTGPLRGMGKKQRQGIILANILRPDVCGRKIHLIFKDTKSDPGHTSEVVFQLIKDYKPLFLVGGATNDEALPAIRLANRFKVPVVITTSTSPLITGNSDYAWRACVSDSLRAKVAANLVMNKTDKGRVSLIVDQDRYSSVMLASAFASQIVKSGGSIVSTSFINTGQKEFIPLMASILSGNSESVFCAAPAKESALIINGARKRGINVPFFLTDIFRESQLLSYLNKNIRDVYIITDFSVGCKHTKIGKRFLERYRKQTGGNEMDSSVALAADAYFMTTDVIKMMHSGNSKNIKSAFSSITGDTYVCSRIIMKANGDPLRPLFVSNIKNKNLKYVDSVYFDISK